MGALTEVIPYLGPWLGAIPPVIDALVVHPISALWVALLFLGIQQIEGHVVVPKLMGNALRLHPLLVILGLAAAAETYGSSARSSRCRCLPPAVRSGSSSAAASRSSRGTARRRCPPTRQGWGVPFRREHLPRHPPAPAAPHRGAARAGARDAALRRRPGDAVVRRARGAARRAAARARAPRSTASSPSARRPYGSA